MARFILITYHLDEIHKAKSDLNQLRIIHTEMEKNKHVKR